MTRRDLQKEISSLLHEFCEPEEVIYWCPYPFDDEILDWDTILAVLQEIAENNESDEDHCLDPETVEEIYGIKPSK